MLTEKQLKNLENLTKISRFRKLLKNSIEQWKKDDVTYTTGSYGITIINEKYDFLHENKACCLLGASLIGKIPNSIGDIESAIYDNYFIGKREFYNLYLGFDSSDEVKNNDAFKFGRNVKNVLYFEEENFPIGNLIEDMK